MTSSTVEHVEPTDPASLPVDVRRRLLMARDALLHGDVSAAYHELYLIASPKCDKLSDDVWAALEAGTEGRPIYQPHEPAGDAP
jgi:hypothetical protein